MIDLLDAIRAHVHEGWVIPALYDLGLMTWEEEAFDWLGFALLGLVQIAVCIALCGTLEKWRPVERWDDHGPVRTDILYTLLIRLGILPLAVFVLFRPLQVWLHGTIVDYGAVPPTLESLFPALREAPLLALAVYVVVLDFGEYWRHRLQHAIPWWWELHAVHHAQKQMTFWTDDRNHLADDIIAAIWLGLLALAIGVPPAQFPVIVLVTRIVESLSHANARLSFGRVGERLLVSPRFHRAHHGEQATDVQGVNYGVLLPVWDWIFGTADWNRRHYPATGVPGADPAIVSGGFWAQQVSGLRAALGRIWPRAKRQPES
ncbi:sterol desaturase family protein [Falsiroseomonas tokyonensis]|uniref:Sterol desaturase family protein n=1 Tax=Falsiroseomonas tokyonensis TaxID=430521 RepID=A0ABV7BUR5_9PROT|nr:sterol desaturase family protein [Falsiroseomonas tokyonensis]MBU8538983.1 sterol desaturase family protein [Falsiroseomonas tokyonensis]